MRSRLSTINYSNLWMLPSFPGVCVAVEAFHSPAIILCTPIARTQISFWFYGFIGVVYQLYVFKFMNASSPGVCGVYAFHSPVIILCSPIVRIKMHFGFIVSCNK